MEIEFTVFGVPQQKGSKQAFVNKRKDGSSFAGLKDTNPRAKPWQGEVRAAAAKAYQGALIDAPCHLYLDFFFPRPQAHYGSGKNSEKLKPSAPKYHAQTPDKDKLERVVADALEKVIVKNDSRFCGGCTNRHWTESAACVKIRVVVLDQDLAAPSSPAPQPPDAPF